MTPQERLDEILALKTVLASGAVQVSEPDKLPLADRLLILLAEHILAA
jgi:hypothetical protein